MAENIHLEVVTPEGIVISEEAQIVASPGSLGEFGVLSGHTPFLTTLKTGIIRYADANGKEHYVFVSGVTVLAESAEKRSDIDLERAKEALARAEKRLAEDRAREEIDFARARGSLERATVRIRLVGLS
jgi:F-type H+-transporting ATPase subunit epsilon